MNESPSMQEADSEIVAVEPAGVYDRVFYADGTFEDVPPLYPRESTV